MKKCILFTIFAGVLSLFTACKDVEIGLGSAVDTEAAKLTVNETPRAGDVVRGSFMLSGICTDDTEIKSFTITFENTAEKDQKIEFSTTPDKTTGEWALIIDPRQELTTSGSTLAGTNKTGITPETQMVPDGEYQVTFKVIDQVKHETIVTRQFKIDNTPPVIVIERPSSKKDAAENSIDSYGQSFTLEGQSADDNDVKTIEVRVYDEVPGAEEAVETSEAETPAASIVTPKIITLNNVPSRINMDIAKYVQGKENDYSEIYGSTEKAGSKKFYCELIAYDSAVRYPIDGSEQSEDDLKGNKTDFYYLLTDISTDILSKYKITDVYHMLSGTYKATGTDSTDREEAACYGEEYVKKYLSRSEKKTAMGSFTLNPENSPSFTVMGRAQLKTEGKLFSDDDEYSDYKVTNENTLMIEVTTGLDSIPLLTEEKWAENPEYSERYQDYKFRPYFTECDENGIELNAQNRIYPTQVTKKVSGLNHQFTVVIKKEDGFQYRHNYRIGVEGFDESGNSILNTGSGYGFRFVSNGMPPTIKVEEPKERTTRLKGGEGIRFKGTILTEDGTPIITLYKSSDKDNNKTEDEIFKKVFTEADARINEDTLMLEYDYDETLTPDKFDQNESQEYTITLRANNGNSSRNTEDTKTVRYDVDGPNINITDRRPIVSLNGKNNINRILTVKGNLDDDFDNVESAEWKLTQEDESGELKTILSGNEIKTVFTIEVDTTKAQDKKQACFEIIARDRSGNETKYTEDFFVDQSTDIPTLAPSDPDSLTFSFKNKAQLIQGNKGVTQDDAKNIYTANSQILMNFTDDDGIAKIELTATADPDNYGEMPEPSTSSVLPTNATEFTYAYKAPVVDGYYTIDVKVTDSFDVSAEQSFSILVSGEIPEVKISTSPEFITTNTENIAPDAKKSFTVKGVNSGTTPFQAVTRNDEQLPESVYVGTDGVADSLKVKWTDNYTPGTADSNKTSTGEVVYCAYDAYGIGSKEVVFKYKVDNAHPAAVITSCLDPSSSQGSSFRFIGTATDDEDGSGVVDVQIRIDNKEAGSTSAQSWNELKALDNSADKKPVSTGWIKASGTDSWNSQLVFDEYTNVFSKEGNKVLYVRVSDVAGNYNEMTKQEFVYDKADPVLTVDESTYQRYMGNGGYVLSGTASDSYALKEVKIYETKDEVETSESGKVITVGADGKWNVKLPLGIETPAYVLSDGKYTYRVVAEDIAGNKKSSNEYETIVDVTPPQIEIEKPAANSIVSETRSNFNGTILDSSGVKAVWYKILAKGSTAPIVPQSSSSALLAGTWNGWSLANTGTTVWDFDQNFRAGDAAESSDSLSEGSWTLYMVAVDNAGMVSKLLVNDFDVDMSYPSIETWLDSALLDESMTQTKTAAYTFKYKVTETYGLVENNPVLTIIKDNDTEHPVTFTQVDETETVEDESVPTGYKLVLITSQDDGLYEYSISATDLVGRETKIKRNILLDTTAPVVTVASPDLSVWQNVTTVKINGSADDKSGTQAVWYSYGVDRTIPATATKLDSSWTKNGWNKATGTTSWSITLTDIAEGSQKNLYITAVDTNGAVATGTQMISAIVKVDATNPTLTETGIGAGTQYKNAAFALSGIAEDNGSGLAELTITDGTKTWAVTPNDGSVNPADKGKWTLNVETAFLHEGTNAYTITATDNAGRVTTESRTVFYDITKPVVSSKAVTTNGVVIGEANGAGGKTWYKTNQIGVSIVPNDPNGENSTTGSGITQIECSTDKISWTVLGPGEAADSYVGNVSCSEQGENIIYIRITDRAGNTNEPASGAAWAEANTIPVYIDTQNPTFTEVKEVLADGTEAAFTGVKLVTGREPLTISVNASDIGEVAKQSGLATVILTGIDGTSKNIAANYDEATGKYKMTIATTDMPNELTPVNVKVTVADKAGNSDEITAFQLQKDNCYPSITVNNITDADNEVDGTQVNGEITVSGTSSDTHTLTSIKLQYSISTSSTSNDVTTWSDWSDWTDYSDSDNTGTVYSWSYTINTATCFADESKVRFRAIATDEAGNSGNSGNDEAQYDSTNYKEVHVSQKTDRPVIRISNFNMGGMTSSSPVWYNSKDLFGTVSDDDGEIKSVKIIIKDTEPIESEWNATAEAYNRGSWSYRLDTDGTKHIYFRVVDAKNKVFISNEANTIFGPKLVDSVSPVPNNTDSKASDILYVKVDNVQPNLVSLYYYASETEITKDNFASDDFASINWTEQSVIATTISEKLGGKKKYLYFKYSAFDTNGIDSIKAELAGTDVTESHHKQMNADATTKEYISYFDISSITAGNAKLVIKMKDLAAAASTSGTETPATFEIQNLDNASPSISFSNYKSGEQVYGSSSITLRGTTSDKNEVTTVWYALGKDKDSVPLDGWKVITKESEDDDIYTSALSWQIVFDGRTDINSDPSSYHAPLLKDSLFGLYNIAEEDRPSYEEIQKIYVWIRAEDELGNDCTNGTWDENTLEIQDTFCFEVIPNGDTPSINIAYPEDGAKIGGTIRINGTTDIEDTSARVEKVYLQIDPDYDGTFDEAGWATELGSLMDTADVSTYEIKDLSTEVVNGVNLGEKIGSGIVAKGSVSNWSLSVNTNLELNGKIGTGENAKNRVIGIRAFAVSSTGKVSCSNVYSCSIDPDAPVFGETNELRFVQHDEYGNEIASRKFENGIFLKGQWYLVGSVGDDSGISNIILTKNDTSTENLVINKDIKDSTQVSSFENEKEKGYNLIIPVGSTAENDYGTISYKVYAQDAAQGISSTIEFSIYYDNKAPAFEVLTGNSKPITAETKIYQSDGTYSVAGTFTETSGNGKNQSGFGRIAMFFTRNRVVDGTKKLYLLDPMVDDETDDNKNGDANFVELGTYDAEDNFTLKSDFEKTEDGIYWRKAKATKLENTKELTIKDSLPANVRVGGLCKVDSVSYRIKAIDGTTLELDGTLSEFDSTRVSNPDAEKDVYFALAQIIDNLIQETGTTKIASGEDTTINGDGDFMVEGVQFIGGVYKWSACLDSSNMLDGKVNMCFVAYDAAGNYTTQTIVQKISNNAPRIASVSFGADTDLNGEIDNGELRLYSNIRNETAFNPYTEGEMTERLVVKGAVKVIPEIIGGNGGLGYSYIYLKQLESGNEYKSTAVKDYGVIHSNTGLPRTDDLHIDISLKQFLEIGIAEGEQDLTFNIWDKTDDAVLGETNSEKATITIPVTVMIKDINAPVVEIEPFYWNKAEKNANSIYMGNPAYGHIELESDLPDDFTASSGINDKDAKVSGKITFEGKATDAVIINIIKAKIPGYKGGNPFVVAERDSSKTTTLGWTSESLYYEDTNNNPVEGAANTLTDNDWVFELLDSYYEADGNNIVEFKFHFNTEKIATVAAEDVKIEFTAFDKGYSAIAETEEEIAADTDHDGIIEKDPNESEPEIYQVDIVPYITKVYTSLAKLKSNNWSVYNRTALGHYAVASNETIYLYGFNLGNNFHNEENDTYPYRPHYGATELAAPVNGGVNEIVVDEETVTPPYPHGDDYASYSVVTFPVSNVTTSGEIAITVNGVSSLNNSNKNDAKGTYGGTPTKVTGDKDVYDNYYNRQPNGDNNNLLTDDVVVDVWEIDSQAVKPKIGGITQPVMNINPTNGQIGFAFVNGSLFYSMPYGTKKGFNDTEATKEKVYSYYYWLGGIDVWTSVSFAYDEYGHSFGTTAGGDINEQKADQFRIMTSRWGDAGLFYKAYNDGKNQLRLELIGQQEYSETDTGYEVYPSFNKERVQSPALVTTASDANNTTVYLAYYDDCNDEIRFKWGGFNDTARTATGGFFADIYGQGGDNNNSSYKSIEKGKYINGNSGAMYAIYRLNYNSLIAGQTKDHVTSSTGTKVSTEVKTTDNQSVYAGKYVSIEALKGKGINYIPEDSESSIKDDAVVAIWWDGTHNQLLYSYNKNPHGIAPGEYLQADTGWTKPVPIFATGIGEYCKIKADSLNGIHIVGFDSNNSDVWYAYVANFENPNGKKTCLVDSYGIIGTELNIDVALKNGKPVPYISYYANSCVRPKTAHLVGSIDSLKQGSKEDAFTAEWEISVIPTSSTVPQDHINIGVWKTNGVLSNSVHNNNSYNTGTDSGEKVASYGSIWGNGTANPVLGYAITTGNSGFIETAQMK